MRSWLVKCTKMVFLSCSYNELHVLHSNETFLFRSAIEQGRKSTIIAGTVVGTFIICFLPNALFNVAATPWLYTTRLGIIINCTFMNIVFCNSIMNVFIYTSRNEAFRKTYKQIFGIKTVQSQGRESQCNSISHTVSTRLEYAVT